MFRQLLRICRASPIRQRHGALYLRGFTCTPTISAEEKKPSAPSATDLDGGRCLARLSKMAFALQDAIESERISNEQTPELIITLEQEIAEAIDLVRSALDKAGRPCTVEELADRTIHNIVPIPSHALELSSYLDAATIRDQMEDHLVSLNVEPPIDALLDRSGLPFSRKDRQKELRRRARYAAGLPPDPADEPEQSVDNGNLIVQRQGLELTELRPVTLEQLQQRKLYLEKSTAIDTLLQGYETALLEVGRVHKVVKGGTTMSMRALVVVGNRKGVAGYGEGKSDTVQHAIERACRDAKRNMLPLELHQERTIYHRTKGKFVKSEVVLWPAPRGTGISANNNFNAVFQLFGIKDIGAKLHGPRSLINAVKALFNALSNLETPRSVAERRGLDMLPPNPSLRELGIPQKKIRGW